MNPDRMYEEPEPLDLDELADIEDMPWDVIA